MVTKYYALVLRFRVAAKQDFKNFAKHEVFHEIILNVATFCEIPKNFKF